MVRIFVKTFIIFFFISSLSYGLSLREAVKLAKENYPKLKSEEKKLLSVKFSYKSELFNFFPTVSYSFNYSKYNDINPLEYFSRTHSLTINWTIFDSGKNIIQYKLEKTNYLYQRENFKEEIINLVYKVKKAYFTATAKKEILRYRKIQLKSAEVDYKLSLEKFKLGLVKKSDVLNAKVRYENTKYLYIQSEADYQTSLAELNSLLGIPLEQRTEINEKVLYTYCESNLENFESLYNQFLKNRPIVKSLKYKKRLASLEREKYIYSYAPTVSVFFQKNKVYNSLTGKDNYNIYGVRFDWLLFDGLGRYHNYLSAKYNELSTEYQVEETLRELKLSLFKMYIEYKKNLEKVNLAKEIIRQSEENYKQTLGEYKVGKNDIVALISSESSLADAQINLVNSVLNLVLTKIKIEKEIGKLD
ncbi:MAG: hypothetical protein DSY59_01115 [Persephonella sp.]|nr:MAG: hypothetical protein DSY60_03510 [Persephonella sp.]RUM61864.1 MAG: hypothetical protein DSY59_01115 [Persephonella sp.]